MQQFTRRSALAGLAALALPLHAQTWPSRPIRIIVPYPTGGVSDLVARAIGEKLAAALGQPVVVENKAGASGTIGMDVLAKAQPDGHTLAFSAISPLTLSPVVGKVPYDAEKDFTPVASAMISPVLLLATPALAARDFRELLTRARDWPNTIRWATSGQASLGHLMLEQLQAAAKVRMVHIPYKGGGQQVTDALSGQFEVLSTNAGPVISEHIKSGRLRPLAVGAPRRLDTLPQVPTLAELGFPAANLSSQFGFFAPGNLPVRISDRLNGEINKALESEDVRKRLVASENVPTGGTARDFARQVAAEADSTAQIVKAVGIKAD
ncbi:tripartite tricarboxylate transporter substrate binding protein [Ramlibacter sp. USB13]|uniref:Tripartite tricarboxylate transporter substrate binding protein n=1 Tax=Ramlibacter cellulosilyticus TaxID=2764187 RepID=A0A923MPD8_9BURK|nr:tripartite tricarboxylate transporter substrate binding protein [Ramlibacter cellulosilyticus]MBC5782401.1 tripartite tricarboxylate transporter substrate binding protein [Ramlibacter cellulosilyticus]